MKSICLLAVLFIARLVLFKDQLPNPGSYPGFVVRNNGPRLTARTETSQLQPLQQAFCIISRERGLAEDTILLATPVSRPPDVSVHGTVDGTLGQSSIIPYDCADPPWATGNALGYHM